MHDFFSSLPKLCEDPSDVVAAAAFSAIEAMLQRHPLCVTAVDKELESFWGAEGEDQQPRQRRRMGPGGGEEEGGGGTAGGAFCGHKQVRVQWGCLLVGEESASDRAWDGFFCQVFFLEMVGERFCQDLG